MRRTIGVVMTSHIVAGLIEDHKLAGPIHRYPANPDDYQGLLDLPFENLCGLICDQVAELGRSGSVDAVGVAIPGIVRGGVVEDSPNLAQLKGENIAGALGRALAARGIEAPVHTFNDADATAAGLAATRGQLDRIVRVWTLGNGIGFGRYPFLEGVWEGGHMVVTLDPKETYCGCGGRGHLEGIMGHRAMRLRFLDMEPEEVFAAAKKGERRCVDFVRLWHRALAAATASAIHMSGPGRFYYTGINARFLDLKLLKEYLWQMVKMSPLQSYSTEIIPEDNEVSVIGAGTAAGLAARG